MGSSEWHSTNHLLVWSVQVTPAGRSYFRLKQLEPRTKDIGALLLPTVCAADKSGHGYQYDNGDRTKIRLTLPGYVRMIPTMHANAHTGPGRRGLGGVNIQTALKESTGMKLQPAFAEWMMGFPIGWTELRR